MSAGLDDVVAAETVLSSVDGAKGVLIIRGFALADLTRRHTFESATHLLFQGFFPDLPPVADFAHALGQARTRVFDLVDGMDAHIVRMPPMDAMRALIARLDDDDGLDTALLLLAAPAVLLPAIVRARHRLAPIAPDATRSHAEDLLTMLTGKSPDADARAALDTYLVTVIDHGLNASTFAARVVASTWAGLTSSMLAGMSALKGPLHGGAPGPVIAMLDGIGTPENASAWIENALDHGERLMGFGHRIYKVRDPRADALKNAIEQMAGGSNALPGRLALASAVECAATDILHRRKPEQSLEVNVEFYTALLLEVLGFPPDAFTGVFATGRTAGWLAHAREQRLNGRLLRPQSSYIGPSVIAS